LHPVPLAELVADAGDARGAFAAMNGPHNHALVRELQQRIGERFEVVAARIDEASASINPASPEFGSAPVIVQLRPKADLYRTGPDALFESMGLTHWQRLAATPSHGVRTPAAPSRDDGEAEHEPLPNITGVNVEQVRPLNDVPGVLRGKRFAALVFEAGRDIGLGGMVYTRAIDANDAAESGVEDNDHSTGLDDAADGEDSNHPVELTQRLDIELDTAGLLYQLRGVAHREEIASMGDAGADGAGERDGVARDGEVLLAGTPGFAAAKRSLAAALERAFPRLTALDRSLGRGPELARSPAALRFRCELSVIDLAERGARRGDGDDDGGGVLTGGDRVSFAITFRPWADAIVDPNAPGAPRPSMLAPQRFLEGDGYAAWDARADLFAAELGAAGAASTPIGAVIAASFAADDAAVVLSEWSIVDALLELDMLDVSLLDVGGTGGVGRVANRPRPLWFTLGEMADGAEKAVELPIIGPDRALRLTMRLEGAIPGVSAPDWVRQHRAAEPTGRWVLMFERLSRDLADSVGVAHAAVSERLLGVLEPGDAVISGDAAEADVSWSGPPADRWLDLGPNGAVPAAWRGALQGAETITTPGDAVLAVRAQAVDEPELVAMVDAVGLFEVVMSLAAVERHVTPSVFEQDFASIGEGFVTPPAGRSRGRAVGPMRVGLIAPAGVGLAPLREHLVAVGLRDADARMVYAALVGWVRARGGTVTVYETPGVAGEADGG
jgi:hypothetical protein